MNPLQFLEIALLVINLKDPALSLQLKLIKLKTQN